MGMLLNRHKRENVTTSEATQPKKRATKKAEAEPKPDTEKE